MRYMGGKSRIAAPIADILSQRIKQTDNKTFISLFCGALNVESKVKGYKKIICNDNHEYLIEMLKGVQNGYKLPETISEAQYKYIRDHKDEDKILTGFVGFACAFGGKWFGGYARGGKRNFCADGKNSLLRKMSNLSTAKYICSDYTNVEIPQGAVVYADPPYADTTGYGKVKFDSKAFWEYARCVASKADIFISEQKAPDDFVAIWEKPTKRTLDVNKSNNFTITERLFVHKTTYEKLTNKKTTSD